MGRLKSKISAKTPATSTAKEHCSTFDQYSLEHKLVATTVAAEDKGVVEFIKSRVTANRPEEAFMVVRLGAIAREVAALRVAFPGITITHPVRANPTPEVLRALTSLGVQFTVSSSAEVAAVVAAGMNPHATIVLDAHPSSRTPSHLRALATAKVRAMVVADSCSLKRAVAAAPGAALVLHTSVGVAAAVRLHGEAAALGVRISALALRLPEGGGGVAAAGDAADADEAAAYAGALHTCAMEAVAVAAALATAGTIVTSLHLTGGHPRAAHRAALASILANATLKVSLDTAGALVRGSHSLAVRVVSKRESADGGEAMYYVNDGVYGSFSSLVFPGPHAPSWAAKAVSAPLAICVPALGAAGSAAVTAATTEAAGRRACVFGPTCDSLDKLPLPDGCQLPVLAVGDWLVFSNMGAYTVAGATPFNGFVLPSLVFMDSTTVAQP